MTWVVFSESRLGNDQWRVVSTPYQYFSAVSMSISAEVTDTKKRKKKTLSQPQYFSGALSLSLSPGMRVNKNHVFIISDHYHYAPMLSVWAHTHDPQQFSHNATVLETKIYPSPASHPQTFWNMTKAEVSPLDPSLCNVWWELWHHPLVSPIVSTNKRQKNPFAHLKL